ncbi:YceD family protein [Plantibacter sp. Mn2098]|uniref:YceD family protein n=1 Tax=Plantibacter sp. Mn2098 TaxID=3395266 RepID=UPI003BCE4B8F
MREHDYEIVLTDHLGEGLVAVAEGSTIFEHVRLESVHEGVLVTGEVDTTAVGECGRCLRDISLPVEVEFQELFAYPGQEASDFEVHDDHVDLESLVRDAVVLALPFQPVCQPDCPGLDPETGERLAEIPERNPQEATDPRWAALSSFSTDPSAGDTSTADREEK